MQGEEGEWKEKEHAEDDDGAQGDHHFPVFVATMKMVAMEVVVVDSWFAL